jgi:hypothetical protein
MGKKGLLEKIVRAAVDEQAEQLSPMQLPLFESCCSKSQE